MALALTADSPATTVLSSVPHLWHGYDGDEVKKGQSAERQGLPRWDSFPMGYAPPRWDAGVRYWPGAVILGSALPLWVGLSVAFGFSKGALITAAVVAVYPITLILVPIRKRLVPREVGSAASAAPIRLWALGLCLYAALFASYALFTNVVIDADTPINPIIFTGLYAFVCALIGGSGWCIRKAPAWEQWRNRPRKRGRRARTDPHV